MLHSEEKIRTYRGTKTCFEIVTRQTRTYNEKGAIVKRGDVAYSLNTGLDVLDLTENEFASLCEIIMDMGNVNAD